MKPFVIGNKTDKNDARAILEASFRKGVRFVPVKTLEQQDIQSLFRIRESQVRMRTQTSNQLRGLLSEYGVVLAKGRGALSQVPSLVDDLSNGLTLCAREFCTQLYEQVNWLTQQIEAQEQKLQALLSSQSAYHRLLEVPGFGPIVTAMLLAAPDASRFKNGRQFAAWTGLTPKCFASGERSQMRGLSKRGNESLRRLLIHGARTVFTWCEKRDDPFRQWCQGLKKRLPACKAIVAIANKLARIAWALLAKKQPYQPVLACRGEEGKINHSFGLTKKKKALSFQ